MEISSASLVKMRISLSGRKNASAKKTAAMATAYRSAMDSSFRTAAKSPLP